MKSQPNTGATAAVSPTTKIPPKATVISVASEMVPLELIRKYASKKPVFGQQRRRQRK
jgi:hypothetical protein